MKTPRFWIPTVALALVLAPAALYAQAPLGTAFTFQGQLKQAGEPASGQADFVFTLWDAETGGDPIGSAGLALVDVVDGLFTVQLDFGAAAFDGDARWLEIEVEFPSGAGNWTTLSPRQSVAAAPYALMAAETVGVDGHSLDAADGSPVNVVYVNTEGQVRLGGTGGAGPKTVNIHGGMDVFDDDGIGNSEGIRFTSNSYEFAELVGETPIWDYYQATDTHRFYTGDQTLRMTITSDGNVGIGTPTPSYPLHVESDSPNGPAIFGLAANSDQSSTGIGVYGRSDSDAGAGVYGEATYITGAAYGVRGVSAYGTGVQGERQDTGNFGALGRRFEGVYGESAYGVSGIGVHGKWTGSFPGFGYGGAFATTSHLAAGVLGINEATEAGGIGVIGVHEHTAGAGYGVRGETASSDGHGVYGYNQATGNYGILGSGQFGVDGHGDSAGGCFEDTDGSGYAYVGYGDRGVEALGGEAGGYFGDTDGSGYAYVARGNRGIDAKGSEAGGYFEDTNSSGYAYVGYGDCGIEARGSDAGGYFEDTGGTAYAHVAHGTQGIAAFGDIVGGYFQDTDASSYAYLAFSQRGIEAEGSEAGGYFGDTNDSGYAYVGYGDRGIEALGSDGGGYFEDTDHAGFAYVGYGGYKICGNGAVSFVQNHPEEPDEVIAYACPEGDEVATYTRGSARLIGGRAIVPLGGTFKWVTNPDIGLTAHLTPRGKCEGLYVESLTTEELVVGELHDGTSGVAFDYIVYGLRIGFEEVSIVQEKEREAYIASMADHRSLYERRPELRDYNAFERFKRMRAAAGQTEPLDLSASQALHDAIVEFDPEIHSVEDPHTPRTEHMRDADGDAEHGPAPSSHVGPPDIPERSLPESLPEIINHKDAEIEALRAECAARQQRIETLESRLTRLEALLSTPSGQ